MAAFGFLRPASQSIEGRLDGGTHTLAQVLQALTLAGRSGCLSLRAARGRVTGAININAGRVLNARLGPFTGEEALEAAQAIRRLDYVLDEGLTDKTEALPADCLNRLLQTAAPRLNLAACTVYSIQADGTVRGGRSDDDTARFEAEYRYLRHYGDVIGLGLAGAHASAAVVWENIHCLGYRETTNGITGIIAPKTHSLSQLLATL